MASTRSAPRRAPTNLSSPSPSQLRPPPVISVEEWESKAPLGELETRSVALIKEASEKLPLPLKFQTDDPSHSRPSTPRLRFTGSRPGTPVQAGSSKLAVQAGSSSHALHPKQPIQTLEQFYDWFALIDRSVTHSQEAHFRAHLAGVSQHLDECDFLVDRIEEIDKEVSDMLQGWRSVEDGGKSLKEACEKLLEERDRLLDLTDNIGARLEYFQELEHATRMLNHPGESLVLQTDFLYMVERVGVCIDFLKLHRHYKDAEVYLLRFQQCMTRAMTLIKMFFVGSLRALSSDVSKKLSEREISSTASTHLLYTRFHTVSTQVAPLIGELERRAEAHPAELSTLLSECHAAYFSTRKTLLVGRVVEEIRGLDPARTELVELTRAGCSYLKQLCTDEFELYREFFSTGEDQLYSYLENLCDYLYDDLRPRILHEPRLTALCEVCTVLQALMVLDVVDDELVDDSDSDDSDELNLDIDPSQPRTKQRGLGHLHISHLLQMVLQDAQTRLFFKAQSVIQSDIRYYVPKPEDLAYPDKLVNARKPATTFEIKEKESISQLFQITSLEKRETWYPTLQKTVWVLSQLHDFVKPAIFEDIAQEAVGLCRYSLVSASETIKTKNSSTSVVDGCLFLIRHLLILKEITNSLDLVQKDMGLDEFGGVTETLAAMLNKTTSLLPSNLFASLGMPKTEESISEAKHGIDHDLRNACEAVIACCADPITDPLIKWVIQVDEFNGVRRAQALAAQSDPVPVTAQDFAQRSVIETLDSNFRAACNRDFRATVIRMKLYLESDKTVGVLVDHIRGRILEEYLAWKDKVWSVHSGDTRNVVMKESEVKEMLDAICRDGSDSPRQA
ncbi:hypothetical protein CCMSSC00406_0003887 [Pleurotus cornucopiae]|uniref:Uncharacterized protein n=1 Tax=Pleurotus cornucopiae TaxID=5321 RepID=A0ACB7ITN6_PLECO|nr:hypothetical protein CCMSSC00406_0003887 [Pleurotus cornucopiae]